MVFHKEIFNNLIQGKISILDIRYYKRWKYYLEPGRSSVTDRLPWINFPAIDLLTTILKPDHTVFEYGGGGSTLYFLDRVKQLVTVEHNSEWFNILKKNLTQPELLKWQGNLIPADERNEQKVFNSAMPDDYHSDDLDFQQMSFKGYASYIDNFPDEYFDVILVDGRARPSCVKHAVNKVKNGGILILDNAERDYYFTHSNSYLKSFVLLLDKFAPTPFIHHFVQTNVYKKIAK